VTRSYYNEHGVENINVESESSLDDWGLTNVQTSSARVLPLHCTRELEMILKRRNLSIENDAEDSLGFDAAGVQPGLSQPESIAAVKTYSHPPGRQTLRWMTGLEGAACKVEFILESKLFPSAPDAAKRGAPAKTIGTNESAIHMAKFTGHSLTLTPGA
jgi:hypothetical protein